VILVVSNDCRAIGLAYRLRGLAMVLDPAHTRCGEGFVERGKEGDGAIVLSPDVLVEGEAFGSSMRSKVLGLQWPFLCAGARVPFDISGVVATEIVGMRTEGEWVKVAEVQSEWLLQEGGGGPRGRHAPWVTAVRPLEQHDILDLLSEELGDEYEGFLVLGLDQTGAVVRMTGYPTSMQMAPVMEVGEREGIGVALRVEAGAAGKPVEFEDDALRHIWPECLRRDDEGKCWTTHAGRTAFIATGWGSLRDAFRRARRTVERAGLEDGVWRRTMPRKLFND